VVGLCVSEVLADMANLDPDQAAWDGLAVKASLPYSAPGWAIPWWSSVRPPGCEFRAVAVRDETGLVGLAPFHLSRDRFGITNWSLLGDSVSSYLEPLAKLEGLESVAAAIATALAGADKNLDVLSLRAIPRTSPWPRMLCESWPDTRPRLSVVKTTRAPYIDIPEGGYDEWLASRSRNFRQQLHSRRRELVRRGGQFRRGASPEKVTSGLEEFERLHRGRWEHRGGSQALTMPVAEMLRQAGATLCPSRFQVWTAELDGVAVAAALFIAAGTQMHYWLGGFDERWSRWSPSLVLLCEVVRYAADAGYRRVALGPGEQPYKYRLATGEDLLDWIDLIPHGRRYPYVRLCQSPYHLYRVASNRTPPHVKRRIRSSVGRVLGSLRPQVEQEKSILEPA
jgi:CelD/BcsL family acetyltransferase involved in cellulose biosynthesis